jgi:hypothetical protein
MIVIQYKDEQNPTYEFNISPRDYHRIYPITLKLTEIATDKVIAISEVSAYNNGDDWVCVEFTVANDQDDQVLKRRNIPKYGYQYKVEITRDGDTFYRGMAYVSHIAIDDTKKHSLELEAGTHRDTTYTDTFNNRKAGGYDDFVKTDEVTIE